MDTYRYPTSSALYQRATTVIPGGVQGHLGPSQGCFIPASAYPFFAQRAEGAYIWDVDGNRFIDYMCAYGPNILGYNDPDVNAAAFAQYAEGDCMVLPSVKMVELAELLVDHVAMADWALFAKNGGDVTSQALMIARAATGREKVILFKGHYHGVAPWTQKLGYPGITADDVDNNIYCRWGVLEDVERAIAENPGQIAALMATPYHHPVFTDNELPSATWWKEIRRLCTRHGIVLAIDDVRCGFRLDHAGSDHHFGFQADLVCFCKALANGFNISALCGTDALKPAAGSVFYTGSYWLSAVPFAAAIACLTKLKTSNVTAKLRRIGTTLTNGLHAAGAEYGFDLKISGEPAMWFMRITDDDDYRLHQQWVAECVRRGVFFTNHHNLFLNAAVSDDDVSHTLEVAHEAFATIAAQQL